MTIWAGNERSDGLRVLQLPEGRWIALPADDRPAATHCPMCGRLINTIEEARAVADAVLPVLP